MCGYPVRLLARYYLPALFSKVGKVVTLALATSLAVLGVVGVGRLEMGLEPQLAAPTNFYLQVGLIPDFFTALLLRIDS